MAEVKLRDHPLMSYRGVRNWPPVWSRGFTRRGLNLERESIRDEIGILRHATMVEQIPTRCFLFMEYDRRTYTGALLFDDAPFCRQIVQRLEFYIGCSIKEIGDIEVDFTL